jgi:hypothetical protein
LPDANIRLSFQNCNIRAGLSRILPGQRRFARFLWDYLIY